MKKKKNIQPLNFIILFISGVINAFGVTLFLMPVHLYDSGFSGTSILLGQITPDFLPMSLFLVILNIPFFLYGYKKQGFAFTVYSVFTVVIYAITSFIINYFTATRSSSGSPVAGTDLLLCAIFGGIISGAGSGLAIRFGGAIDGVEVLAVIFAKKIGITVGSFVMIYNVILYVVIGFIFQSWILPLYSIITYAAAIKTIDFIVEGFDKAKSVMIVTTKEEEISSALADTFEKGITHIGAKGYYSDTEQTIIYFVVNRFQISKLKNIVKEIDKNAFITISDVSDVLGRSVKKR